MDLPTGAGGRRAAFHRDPYLTSLPSVVIATGDDDRGRFLVLADSVLFPEGGGQPADRGVIRYLEPPGAAVPVVDVQRTDDDVRHYVDPSWAGTLGDGPCRIELDWARRYDHMQQHTAQHLISALAQDRAGWATTSFHLGAETSDIELDVPRLDAAALAELEEGVAAEVRANRTVRSRYAEAASLVNLGVRSRGLPAGHTGPVRVVEIESVDSCACGGTHVASTAELESVKLLHTEPMRGGRRLHFVAGARVRRRLAADESAMAEVRAALGAPTEELGAAARSKAEKAARAAKRVAWLEGQLATEMATRLATQAGPVAVARVDPALVPATAQAYTKLDAPALLVIASTAPEGPFAVAAGGRCEADAQAFGRAVAERLGGTGGGAGALFQGKGAHLGEIEAAAWMFPMSATEHRE